MEPILHRNAADRGYSVRVLGGKAFTQPVAGVSIPAGARDDLVEVCRAVALVLPNYAVFTHLTSAQLRGWWLPPLADCPVIACTDGEAPHLDRRGVYIRRCSIPPEHRDSFNGIRVASATWTIAELAEHLALIDLVAAIDSALHLGHITVPELSRAAIRGRRGVRRLRQAIHLADRRSESRWESVLRLLHVLCGFRVEAQHPVHDATGTVIARADLRITGTPRLPEYDGSDHRTRRQHELDLRRDKLLARRGFERFGYIATEILHDWPRIVRDAEDALNLDHDPRRLTLWRSEFEASTLTAAGLQALRRRLKRFVRTTSPRRVAQP